MSLSTRSLVALALGVGSAGCINTFDDALFRRDAGLDADVADTGTSEPDAHSDLDASSPHDAGIDATLDAPETPSDTPPLDGGPPLFAVADYCTTAPELVLSGASRTIAIDTRGLIDDGSDDVSMCLGTPPVGPDGFFRIHATAGQRWHFHFRHVGDENPALYVLNACDPRACADNQVVNNCPTGADEHLTFQPSVERDYFVGLDSYVAGEGLTGSLEIYRPTCGNGMLEHSETCDDGGTMPGDGCDEQCRDEITGTLTDRGELEVNDDLFSANHILYTSGTPMLVTGRIANACESDWFVVDLPSAGTIAAEIRTSADASCAGSLDVPDPFTLELIASDGLTRLGAGTPSANCPAIDPARDTWASVPAGRYFLRVFGAVESGRRFDYGMRLTVTTP